MLLSRSQKPFILTQIIDYLARLSEKQPRKYIMLKFSNDGLDMSTKDDTSTIFIGVMLKKKVFSAYICQNDTNLLLPLQKLSKIFNLLGEFDDSITVSYESPSDQIKFRIHSTKNNLKTIINLQIPQLQSQNIMINEQYEEPTNPIKQLQKLKSVGHVHNMMSNLNMLNNKIEVSQSQFLIPCVEFYRICRQFSQVCQTFSISLQAQSGSNKKYMIFSGMTGNGIKTISLNQQRSQQEIEESNQIEVPDKYHTKNCKYFIKLISIRGKYSDYFGKGKIYIFGLLYEAGTRLSCVYEYFPAHINQQTQSFIEENITRSYKFQV